MFIKQFLIVLFVFCCLSSPSQKITVVQFQGASKSLTIGVAKAIEKEFKVKVEIIYNAPLPKILMTEYVDNETFNAYSFLSRLISPVVNLKHTKIIGVTNKRLWVYYFGGAQGVFGMSSPTQQNCIITSHALNKPNVLKEAIANAYHELGHLYGVSHCNDMHCYMNVGDGSAGAIDSLTHFCKICKKLL